MSSRRRHAVRGLLSDEVLSLASLAHVAAAGGEDGVVAVFDLRRALGAACLGVGRHHSQQGAHRCLLVGGGPIARSRV